MRVAIVGGTGPFGRALAERLVDAGVEVVLGSRDEERAQAAALELGCSGATNADASEDADLVILAVNSEAAIDTARDLRSSIGTKPVLSVASELQFTKTGVHPSPDPASLAARVQAELAGPVLAGLHSLAAASLGGEEPPDEDAFVCGDDEEAKALALELAAKVVAGRALDAGPLSRARALEGMTAVILHVNRRYRVVAGLKLTGLP